MTLVSTAALLDAQRAVLAFNVIQLEHGEAILRGAELAGRGVILQVSENAARYHGGLAPIGLASLELAREAGTATARPSTPVPATNAAASPGSVRTPGVCAPPLPPIAPSSASTHTPCA